MRVLFRCGARHFPHRPGDPVAANDHAPHAAGFVFENGKEYGPTMLRQEKNPKPSTTRATGTKKRSHLVEHELTEELLAEIEADMTLRYGQGDDPMPFSWSFTRLDAPAVVEDDEPKKAAAKPAASAPATKGNGK